MRDCVTLTFDLLTLTVVIHGGSRAQPCHQVRRVITVPLISTENAYAATAQAPNHVTREQGVKNKYIFGIPDPDLPIHKATFVGSRACTE